MQEKGVLEGFIYCHGLYWKKKDRAKVLAPVCARAFILGLEEDKGICKHSHTAKGTQSLLSCLSQVRRQPHSQGLAAGAVLSWWLGDCVWSESGGNGTMAGMWETSRGTSTAQDGCAALPPLSPLGTTTLGTPLDNPGDAITHQPQPGEEQVATRSSPQEIPQKY